MATRCKTCPLRRRPHFAPMTEDEVAFTDKLKAGELKIEAGTPILMEGSNSPQLYTALAGQGVRYKTLEDGRRQVLNFVMPGDFIGLQAVVMGEMQHSVDSATPMTLCVFDRSDFWRLMKSQPGRAYDLIWMAAVEEHFLGETITSLGQRSATERIAWAMVRLYQRGRAVGIADRGEMRFPFRQQDLADALGLSLVHTNKTLSRLKARQLMSWTDGVLRIPDPEALAGIANIEPGSPPPRPLI